MVKGATKCPLLKGTGPPKGVGLILQRLEMKKRTHSSLPRDIEILAKKRQYRITRLKKIAKEIEKAKKTRDWRKELILEREKRSIIKEIDYYTLKMGELSA